MWVRNLSKFPITLFKAEKIVVLNPGCIADVDLPEGTILARQELELVKLDSKKDRVAGQPATICPTQSTGRRTTGKKRGTRNVIR